MSTELGLQPADHPIFKMHSISELADLTWYSEVYLLDLRSGSKPINKTFRRRAAKALGKSEDHLFTAATT